MHLRKRKHQLKQADRNIQLTILLLQIGTIDHAIIFRHMKRTQVKT